jgi:Tfp pilus assembly protein PilF
MIQNIPISAITDFSKAIEIDPQYGNAYLSRSKAYDQRGDHLSSAADLTRAKELAAAR